MWKWCLIFKDHKCFWYLNAITLKTSISVFWHFNISLKLPLNSQPSPVDLSENTSQFNLLIGSCFVNSILHKMSRCGKTSAFSSQCLWECKQLKTLWFIYITLSFQLRWMETEVTEKQRPLEGPANNAEFHGIDFNIDWSTAAMAILAGFHSISPQELPRFLISCLYLFSKSRNLANLC